MNEIHGAAPVNEIHGSSWGDHYGPRPHRNAEAPGVEHNSPLGGIHLGGAHWGLERSNEGAHAVPDLSFGLSFRSFRSSHPKWQLPPRHSTTPP